MKQYEILSSDYFVLCNIDRRTYLSYCLGRDCGVKIATMSFIPHFNYERGLLSHYAPFRQDEALSDTVTRQKFKKMRRLNVTQL